MLTVKPDKMEETYHYPVMWGEIIEDLEVEKSKSIIDCTAGTGGHALKMLACAKDAFYIGIDKDADSLLKAYQRLGLFANRFVLFQDDYRNLGQICREMEVEKVDTVLLDLGMSSYQLLDPQRGFSFSRDGLLDMRFDKGSFLTAADLVNNLSERELLEIFRKFGEERYARRIVYSLARQRRETPILTTSELSKIIERSVPPKCRFGRIHPATRVFQALRIAVNRELDSLSQALPKAVSRLAKGGRIGVISFHSLEDRIVKHSFRKFASEGLLKIITKKPKLPTEIEKKVNPASRSAKLRIGEKIV